MRKTFGALAVVALLAGAGPAQAGPSGERLALTCGYFAILGCFRDPAAAEEWNAKIEFGHVINTSSMHYVNFRPGWFCVVHGPTSAERAEGVARGWRSVVPDAYVKSSC
jgi:hypothetical protein